MPTQDKEKDDKLLGDTVPKVVIARSTSHQSLPVTALHVSQSPERRGSYILPNELALIGLKRKSR